MVMIEAIGSRGDGDSFTSDMASLIPSLRSMARLLYRNEESAADLAQETLTKAWAARGSFAPGTNLKAWLFTIMRNQYRSEARRAWRQLPWDEQAAERIPGPHAEQVWTMELKDAARAMNSLPKRQRDALVLAGVGGLSSEEAAAAIHCRPTALKSRVSRARYAVRAMLDGTAPLTRERNRGDAMTDLVGELERIAVRPL